MKALPNFIKILGLTLSLSACGDLPPELGNATGSSKDKKTTGPDTPTTATKDISAATTSGTSGASSHVNSACTDGKYREDLTDFSLSIADLEAAYDQSAPMDFMQKAAQRRYPVGFQYMEQVKTDPQCMTFTGMHGKGVVEDLKTASISYHECGHLYDLSKMSFSTSYYFIKPGVEFTCPNAPNGKERTFARSLLNEDLYNAKWGPCAPGQFEGCDSYLSVYLDGDPRDATFQGGDQGIDALMEEVTQYINSLGISYAFSDRTDVQHWGSQRDGILTMLFYVERYLQYGRTHEPEDYNFIINNSCWRDMILTTWGRAWLYLDQTAGKGNMGIQDKKIQELVDDPALLDEIEHVRKKSCP
jgi:hypothetical protein